jgi:hypothetical protein
MEGRTLLGMKPIGRRIIGINLLLALIVSVAASSVILSPVPVQARSKGQSQTCAGLFQSVSPPLNDLGTEEYLRIDPNGGPSLPTVYFGGLYPDGENSRPDTHEEAGLAVASQIQPLDGSGNPNPQNGRIAMISVGMSNTSHEFSEFIHRVSREPAINAQLLVINGAQPGATSDRWIDPNAPAWDVVDMRLAEAGATPAQVQVAWIKQTRPGLPAFPGQTQWIQGDLEAIARNLLIRYPNIKIAYYSSRTRAYRYWKGLSPEPGAFENGYSVKWMLEKQIDENPALNFDPNRGAVVAPYLSWGPYLWADGSNPRSDGFTWLPSDLKTDCIHPSDAGSEKVACLMLEFFAVDTISSGWFLEGSGPVYCHHTYLPAVNFGEN